MGLVLHLFTTSLDKNVIYKCNWSMLLATAVLLG